MAKRKKKLSGQDRARRDIRLALLEAHRTEHATDVDPLLRGEIRPDKRTMEEALHVTCFECGYGGARHAERCSRAG